MKSSMTQELHTGMIINYARFHLPAGQAGVAIKKQIINT